MIDAILVFARLISLIYRRKAVKRYFFYCLGFLRLIRYFSMPFPQKYWLAKIHGLDKLKANNISTVLEIVSALILVTNFLCTFWIFLGSFDYTFQRPNFKGCNSWLIVYKNNDGSPTLENSAFEIYVLSFYFMWEVLATVGYGEIYSTP